MELKCVLSFWVSVDPGVMAIKGYFALSRTGISSSDAVLCHTHDTVCVCHTVYIVYIIHILSHIYSISVGFVKLQCFDKIEESNEKDVLQQELKSYKKIILEQGYPTFLLFSLFHLLFLMSMHIMINIYTKYKQQIEINPHSEAVMTMK